MIPKPPITNTILDDRLKEANRKITINNIINDTNVPLKTWEDIFTTNPCMEIPMPAGLQKGGIFNGFVDKIWK